MIAYRRFNGLVDAALQAHRVCAGGDVLQAFLVDGRRQDGRRGGSVAGDIIGLGGDFFYHLGAHVLKGILELDFLRNGDPVLRDGGRAEFLVDDDISSPGSQGNLDGVGELLDTLEHGPSCFLTIL